MNMEVVIGIELALLTVIAVGVIAIFAAILIGWVQR